MPLSKHYGGHGEEVMASMVKQYGSQKAKRVFYATEKKRQNLDEHIGRTIKHIRRKHKIAKRLGG